MNCQNCGAPMTLFPERSYFFCEYCGSYHFPAESPDGVRLLGPAAKDLACPRCDRRLHHASLDRLAAHQCQQCQGVLVDQTSFRTIVMGRRRRAAGPPAAPRPLDPQELQREVGCPHCGQTMSTHPYYGPGNIVIDTCAGCGVVWLDYGELQQVVDAPGRDRGDFLGLLAWWKDEDEEED